jgi:ribosomal protein S18 acetylase RimI-like enzyme
MHYTIAEWRSCMDNFPDRDCRFCKILYLSFMTINFSDPSIAVAAITDSSAITNLLNSAYRGESSKQGWTTEAHLIAGNVRTNETSVKEVMGQEGSVMLKYTDKESQLMGCVNLQQHGDKIYLGMLSVAPQLQGAGIGKKLLQAAEEYTLQLHGKAVYMTVISVRTELINWYERYGYKDTGERKPFVEDDVSGTHLQPLEFMVMEKLVG